MKSYKKTKKAYEKEKKARGPKAGDAIEVRWSVMICTICVHRLQRHNDYNDSRRVQVR